MSRKREQRGSGVGLLAVLSGAALGAAAWWLTRDDGFEKYRAAENVSKSGGGVLVASRTRAVSAADLIALARTHVGEPYVLGSRVPKADPNYRGPWDCAEFCTWLVYQTTGQIVGARGASVAVADAWTGHWHEDMKKGRVGASDWQTAMETPGAFLLRFPQSGAPGHIALSTGRGGTVEAQSSKVGVVASRSTGRRWDVGILVPGIITGVREHMAPQPQPSVVREGSRGELVTRIQRALGLTADGAFGPQTLKAVLTWQASHDLVADGEVGPATLRTLGLA